MSFHFRPGVRENVPLLIGVAGGTGSGKTYSALRLAKGLAGGKRFAMIDTEAGRGLHYADEFEFDHGHLRPPFSPSAYAEAIAVADKADYPVIVVDSASHEHAGEGGLLDMHDEEFQRMGAREAVKMTSWIKPKQEHKRFVQRLLQLQAHLILCFRAEEKIEMVKDPDGKWQVRPKQSMVGLDGWVPISEKNLPYELTLSFLLTAAHPGIPKPIKLQKQHRAFVPLDKAISEDTGKRLAEWAAGGAEPTRDSQSEPEPDVEGNGEQRSPFEFKPAEGSREHSPLSAEEFRDLLRLEQVTSQKAAAISRKLFPGRTKASPLNDEERGELWQAIRADLESVMF